MHTPTMNSSASPHSTTVARWMALAFQASVVRRALVYSVVVGAILIAINHAEAILRLDVPLTRVMQMGLTVIVPYCVSTLSSVGAMQSGRGGGTPGTDRNSMEPIER